MSPTRPARYTRKMCSVARTSALSDLSTIGMSRTPSAATNTTCKQRVRLGARSWSMRRASLGSDGGSRGHEGGRRGSFAPCPASHLSPTRCSSSPRPPARSVSTATPVRRPAGDRILHGRLPDRELQRPDPAARTRRIATNGAISAAQSGERGVHAHSLAQVARRRRRVAIASGKSFVLVQARSNISVVPAQKTKRPRSVPLRGLGDRKRV